MAAENDGTHWDYYVGPRNTEFVQSFDGPPRPLLELELAWARRREGYLPKAQAKTTLALLVGTSFEPLLQTIRAYQPDRLVPVVNHFYGDRENDRGNHVSGMTKWDDLRRLVARLSIGELDMPETNQLETVQDTPTSVFNHLREKLHADLAAPDRNVVIDISGAKKSMVAGAYLLGAYHSRAIVSYVDFDRWDEGESRPYGYSCKIGEVENPLRRWALREWERVETQYNRYNFVAALDDIPEIPVRGVLTDAVESLTHFIEVCAAWDLGDLAGAKKRLTSLPQLLKDRVPTAVQMLADDWPDPAGQPRLSGTFLLAPQKVVIYATDELSKAIRLAERVRPDYRGAFARSYAVYETMLKARLLALLDLGQVAFAEAKSIAVKKNDAVEAILHGMLTSEVRKLLGLVIGAPRKGWGRYRDGNGKKHQVNFEINTPTTPSVAPPSSIASQDEEELQDRRNLITHTYVPVSREAAERAIALAKAYQREYADTWGKLKDPTFDPNADLGIYAFETPRWRELKELCGLSFLVD